MAPALKEVIKGLVDAPEQYVFRVNDGNVYKNLPELKSGLEKMTDETFSYHSNTGKKDFSNWVRDIIGDEKLAKDLEKATNRLQATKMVAERITMLSKRKK